MHSLGRVIVDDAGEVVRMVGASQDITDRKAAEEIVGHSERRLQTIIDAQPACVKLVSIDGILLDMNRAGLEMVGADDVSQLEGRPVVDLVHQDDRSRYLEMHRAASSGSPGRMEFRMTGLKGGERFVDSRAVPFDTPVRGAGTQRAVLSVTSDITEAPVHLLLTDLVLPGMDGTQLATLVTRERPHARVLFMSGYARGLGSIAGGLDPSIHLLEKPFTAQALLTKTRQLLGIHASEALS